MRTFLILPVLLILSAAPTQDAAKPRKPKLTSKEKTAAKAIIKRYFKEQNLEAREAILAELEPLDHPSKAEALGRLRYPDRREEREPAVTHRREAHANPVERYGLPAVGPAG